MTNTTAVKAMIYRKGESTVTVDHVKGRGFRVRFSHGFGNRSGLSARDLATATATLRANGYVLAESIDA